MEFKGMCRCCLSDGLHKDLQTTYMWMGQKEVYNNMLQECFDISLASSPEVGFSICDKCVVNLRNSLKFKKQVLRSEEVLVMSIKNTYKDQKLLDVKQEIKYDSDRDAAEDSDDYFLADSVMSKTDAPDVKQELDTSAPPLEKIKLSPIKELDSTLRGSQKEKMRAIGTHLSVTRNVCPQKTKQLTNKKSTISEKIKVGKDITVKRVNKIKDKVKGRWPMNKSKIEKEKQKENLQTILQFSNAMPFKNKSLLGYICGYCEVAYPDPKDLRKHTEIDHKKDRLEYKSIFEMSDYNVKLDITDLECLLCDCRLENLYTLKDHLVKQHKKTIHNDIKDHILQYKIKKGEVYDCALCSATYETFKMLKQHMNKHYNNYLCNICNTSFATKRSLNAHKGTHIEGSFQCDHCDKVFSNKIKKQYHEKIKHLGARNISNCPFCDQAFRSYYQRNQHLMKVHNTEAQYKCNICEKAYILKSLLMCHIKKSHLMEKNCQCTECGYRFFSKKALKAHMIKHTGERIHACEVCHKSYARKYTLKEHMRIHNNDRRFKCTACEMSFVQKCSLKSHLLSNHGISMAASEISSSLKD